MVIISTAAIIFTSLWGWDRVTDPIGAADTIALRELFLLTFFLALLFVYFKNYHRWLAFVSVFACLVAEVNFILILNRLEGGMIYGLAGFMYCMFLAVLAFKCFSLRVNIAYTLLSALLPHVAALINLAHNLPHWHYALLIWPAAFLTIISQTVEAYGYLQRYQLQHNLQDLSNTDPLTGIKNRRYFMPQLADEMARAKRSGHKLAILMIDIDHFKRINDQYGHPCGDRVICNVTNICEQCSREIDTVARFGGEEFVIMLLDSDLQLAQQVAERIRIQIAQSIMQSTEKSPFKCTVSIGVAEYQSTDKGELDLIGRADCALYQAKDNGRNKVVAN